ncbi:MAG: 6-phosphofructokinase [Patescibacteria group bacterium]|jgi:6-phosphofructokinase 1
MSLRIASVTGGGHCPGINDVFANLIDLCQGHQLFGYENGWKGLSEDYLCDLSDRDLISRFSASTSSYLGTSRLDPFKAGNEEHLRWIQKALKKFDCLIAVGGEDTLGVASKLSDLGFPVIGIPKTLDNDLPETDYAIGFMTVVDNSIRAILNARDSAFAHQRIEVVETLGRHAGWLALYAGVSSFADWIVLPEFPLDVDAMCKHFTSRNAVSGLVVCAENVKPDGCNEAKVLDGFDHELLRERGVARILAKVIQEKTGIETRWTQLGDSVRGGFPNAFDKILARRFAKHALQLAESGNFGRMVAIKNDVVTDVPLSCARGIKMVPAETVRALWR